MSIKSILWYSLGIIFFIAVIILRNKTFANIKEFTNSVNHSREIITTLQNISLHLKSAQIYSPKYEPSDTFYYRFQAREAKRLPSDLSKLKQLVKKNEFLSKRSDTISFLVKEQYPALMRKNIVELIQSGEGHRLSKIFEIETIISSTIDYEENRLVEQRQSLDDHITQNVAIAIILITFSALIFITGFASNLRSYKKQKWISAFLESVLGSARHGILSFSPADLTMNTSANYKVDYANATAHKLLNYPKGTLIDKYLPELGVFEKLNLVKRLPEVVKGEREYQDQFHFDGLWVQLYCVRRRKGFTISLYDITALKEHEEALKVTIRKLKQNNQQLERYAYAASHDFQEPLRKITVFSERIKSTENSLDEKQKLYLEKIISSSKRMRDLINDTLQYSLLQKVAEFQKVDLNQIVAEVLDDLELMITKKEATIKVASLPVIDGMEVQIRQLFFNLLSNALKFTSTEKKPDISVTCSTLIRDEVSNYPHLDANKKYASIEVKDNGIGFDSNYANNIFELFTKLHTQSEFKGTGIGLALCKQVVINHHGEIFSTSSPGEGASFTIILPVTIK